MEEFISRNSKTWRIINVLSMVSIVFYSIFIIYKVRTEILSMDSPLLPKYATIYMNGSQINVMSFLLGSLIPAVFLTFKKKNFISILVMLIFLIVGFLLREKVLIYENFYWLTEYL